MRVDKGVRTEGCVLVDELGWGFDGETVGNGWGSRDAGDAGRRLVGPILQEV